MIKWISLAIAGIGVTIALLAALTTTAKAPEPPLAAPPSIDPFDRSVAATGLVEGRRRNVRIAPPEPALVREVQVRIGDRVEGGEALFRLDARTIEADLVRARAAVETARASLERRRAEPREEDIPPARAEAERLRAVASNARDAYRRTIEASEREATSERELTRQRFEAEAAEAAARRAEARLARLRDGAWERDIRVAEATLSQRQAEVEALERLIARLTVRAPAAGTILKRNIEPGEFAPVTAGDAALVMADLSTIRVRVQINEEDMPPADRIGEAIARPRSMPDRAVPLTLVRIEPLAVPKRSLTGAAAELVDTRVIEVMFEVTDRSGPRLYPGQLVDVFIERTPEPSEPAASSRDGASGDG